MNHIANILLVLGAVLALIGTNEATTWHGVAVGAAILAVAIAGMVRANL